MWAHQQGRDFIVELVVLIALRIDEGDVAANCVAKVHLALDHIRPTLAEGIFEVRHKAFRT